MKLEEYKTILEEVIKVESAIAEFKVAEKAEQEASRVLDYDNVESRAKWSEASINLEKAERKARRLFKAFMRSHKNPQWDFEYKYTLLSEYEKETYRDIRNSLLLPKFDNLF